MRDSKPLTLGRDEGALEVLAPGEADGVDERVEPLEVAPDAREDGRDLAVGADVTRIDQRAGQGGRELLHVLLQPLPLIGEREPHAGAEERLSDRPRDRALVGDAEHDPSLAVEQTHAWSLRWP